MRFVFVLLFNYGCISQSFQNKFKVLKRRKHESKPAVNVSRFVVYMITLLLGHVHRLHAFTLTARIYTD